MKTRLGKTGIMIGKINLNILISKYEIEIAISELYKNGFILLSKNQIINEIKELISTYGNNFFADYYNDKDEDEGKLKCVGCFYFPEYYTEDEKIEIKKIEMEFMKQAVGRMDLKIEEFINNK